ncbi:Hypothetical Protein FCC1311_063812 [Hondaea fermentalgiana]|uniref:ADP-ribosylglycohydrolase n=1 Tax=Hondaea fermentalgiana TaxID=2315210 RepID=A0A2R5GPB1_9STRA|nr:Hypothetical Protein FCC1311_063812 [Hondaea fermentalgiana]|eukprot:GBG30161.1 Hypothetical Protein FCC1311_063812 [Hondaea fermentalgiana]
MRTRQLGDFGSRVLQRRLAKSRYSGVTVTTRTLDTMSSGGLDEAAVSDKIRGTLLGAVLGESLAMPVHWYYNPQKLKEAYGEVTELRAPKPTHAESMILRFSYNGSIDILHDKKAYYEGCDPEIAAKMTKEERAKVSDEHGNFVGREAEDRPHYHATLKRGQNTSNMCISRLLMRYLGEVLDKGEDRYDPQEYLERFEKYMTTDPREHPDDLAQVFVHNDPYLDSYVRKFFENLSKGVPLMNCAYNQRDNWAINSLDGVLVSIPLIAAYKDDPESGLLGRVVEHHMLTHRSPSVTAALGVVAPLLQQMYQGRDPDEALDAAMEKMRPPRLTGRAMHESYASHNGPDFIPKWEKWDQHMEMAPGKNLKEVVHQYLAEGKSNKDVAGYTEGEGIFSTACYCEQALPIVLFLAAKYKDDFTGALQANAELGGHNTARGAILGAIMGARLGQKALPSAWIDQLAVPDQIAAEIDGIVKVSALRAQQAK